MTDRVMECIVTVAETKSIGKAAKLLYITPSALSRMIQNQERELGIRLFDRAGKNFVPTQAGEAYVRWGRKILAMEASMEEELQRISKGMDGKVRLGFTMALSRTVTERVIPSFRRQFPSVEILLAESTTAELEQQLEEGRLDLAIMPADRFLDTMSYDPLLDEMLVLAVPRNHPILSRAERIEGLAYPWADIRDFSSETFIILYPGQTLRKYTEQVFKENHMSPYIPIQVHTIDTSLRCVKNGLGVTITYDWLISGPAYEDQICPVCFKKQPDIHKLCLIRQKNHNFTKAMEALSKICGEVLQKYGCN